MPAGLLREELGVAISGVKADVAGFKLCQSTEPNVFLFTRDQPVLARGADGRYQVAVSTYRTQVPDRGSVITGGSAVFTVTAAEQYDPDRFTELMQAFQTGVVAKGAPDRASKFIPLNTRKGLAEVLVNPLAGTHQESFNGKDVGTPGGNMSFLVDLHTVDFDVADPQAPFLVTLAWTDPPGPLGSGPASVPAVVNRLLLRVVTSAGDTNWGNVFQEGWSAVDGEPEEARKGTDNLQNVVLPAGVAGTIRGVGRLALGVDQLPHPSPGRPAAGLRARGRQRPPVGRGSRRRHGGGAGPAAAAAAVLDHAARGAASAHHGPRTVLDRRGHRGFEGDPAGPRGRLSPALVTRFRLQRRFPPLVVDIPVRESDPPPADVVPLTVDGTLLLVDPAEYRIHHLLLAPALVSAAVTIQRTPADLRAVGGSASLTVRCDGTPDPQLWVAAGGAWYDALAAAGFGAGPWTATPLELRTLGGALVLPAGHLAAPRRSPPARTPAWSRSAWNCPTRGRGTGSGRSRSARPRP